MRVGPKARAMCAKAHRKSPCSCFLQWLIAAMAFDIPTNHSPQVAAFDPLPLGKIREEGGKSLFEILLDNNTDTKPKDNDGVFYTPLPNTTSIDPKWDGL